MRVFNRRQVLTSAAITAGGLGMVTARFASAGNGALASAPASPSAPRVAGSVVEARDGTRLFHLDWGAGVPVVFCHAWALNADAWEYQMMELVDRGFRCVAYDRRGHGRSADPGRGYDFNTLADDLAAVLDRLDLRDATLVGHSMGGGEIARYLSRHGARRIARVVLTSSITPIVARRPDNPDGSDPATYEAMVAMLKTDRPAALTGGVGLLTGTSDISPAMSQWLTTLFLRSSAGAQIGCMREFATADFRADMQAFTMPTLVIHGDADQLNPLDRTGRRTARAIRGAQLKVYEGAPHGLPVTHHARFNQDLLAFLRS